jgi:hypothetical protein
LTTYSEGFSYWATTVSPSSSQGEIIGLLEDFGASAIMVMQGQANGKYAWVIRFQWKGRSYRFTFIPLECKFPEKFYTIGGRKRSAPEQAKYQMGRIAFFFVKALLTAAETTPAALFGFLELPGMGQGSDIPPTAAELDVEGLTGLLPTLDFKILGPGES